MAEPMSPREVVTRAVEFRTPDRLPLRFDALGLTDFHGVGWGQKGTGDNSKREDLDEWGCTWARTEVSNMGQVKGHPLPDLAMMADFAWPDPDSPAFCQGVEAGLEGASDRYVMVGIFMLIFERMHALHGFEATLADLYVDRERMEELADRIVEFDLRIIRNVASRVGDRVQGFSFTDDWGTELATFVSPEFWRDFFAPRYARIFDACHAAGWHVWMHSCGKVNDIIPHLIDIGLDAVNLQQPRALGIEEMGERFAGKICFESLCDIQATLPFKSDAEIREEAELLLERWATPEGGFVLSDYGDGAAIGVPVEKKRVMLDAFLEADPWKRA